MSGTPAISVLMPIRNGEPYLRAAVQSVIGQTFEDWELIAVLDGCTDNSEQVIKEFRDQRIRVFHMAPPGGFPYTLNFGLEQCRADLVARMDQDDICEPNRLAVQIAEFANRPSLAVLGSSATLIDQDSSVIGFRSVVTGPRRVALSLLWRNQLIHPAVAFRRSLVMELGGYDPRSSPIFEDYDLWLRVVGRGEVDNLPEPLLRYRRHGSQQSRGSRLFPRALATLARSRHQAGAYLRVPGPLLSLLDSYWFMTQVVHRVFVVSRTTAPPSAAS